MRFWRIAPQFMLIAKNIKKNYHNLQNEKHLSFAILIFLFSIHSTNIFGQKDEFERKISSKEVSTFIKGSNVLYWENSVGVFKKDLETGISLLIKDYNSRLNTRTSFIGIDEKYNLWARSSTETLYNFYDGKTWHPVDTITFKNFQLPSKDIRMFLIDNKKQKWIFTKNNELHLVGIDSIKTKQNFGYINKDEKLSSSYFDNKGRLWLTTIKGIYLVDINKDKIIPYQTDELFELTKKTSIYIRSIAVDSSDNIWVGFLPSSLIAKFDKNELKWRIFNRYDCDYISSVGQILIDNNNIKWFNTSNGLLRYNDKNWDFFANEKETYGGNMQFDENYNIWLHFILGSLYKFENNTFTEVIPDFSPLQSNIAPFVFSDKNSLIVSSKLLHIITDKKWQNIDLREIGAKNQKTISDYFIDKSGTKWFGTSTGLLKLEKNKWSVFDRENGLISDYIISFTFDNNDTLWVGTREGLFKFDGTNWTKKTLNEYFYKKDFIKFVKKDNIGNLWIRDSENYGKLYKKTNDNWCLYTDFPNENIQDIKNDLEGNLFFLTNKSIYSVKNGEIYLTDFKLPYFKNVDFHSMAFYKGSIWVMLNNGSFIESTSKKYEIYGNPIVQKMPNFPYSFTIYKSKIYCGTGSGLYGFKINSLKIRTDISKW